MYQDIRNVARDVLSRSERDLLVSVTAYGHFPTLDIEVQVPETYLLTRPMPATENIGEKPTAPR